VIAKDNNWFVKFDEDAMPDFKTLIMRLRDICISTHEKLAG
jgi:hypothetical protein